MGAVAVRVGAQGPACEPPHRVVGEGLRVLSRSQGPGADPCTRAGRRADGTRPGQAVLVVVTEGLVVRAGGGRGGGRGGVAPPRQCGARGGHYRLVTRALYLGVASTATR